MANDRTIAEAYIQIKPSMDGVTGEIKEAMGEAGTSGSASFGSAFADGIAKVGAVASAAVGAAAAGVSALTKQAVSNFADYEQLVGGVDTLFKGSADLVMQNANDAFKSAGLSANEYMETVTGFSASLLQSLGGDTEAAAGVADMAIRDMADNANKMGTSMEAIQYAYQGFAKQNYTMLDNLKLGYGGTKSEMERLLADAQALTGVEYDISNLSDVYEAVHVIQDELGITGTTAAEAEETITGSLASVSSAWQNLLTGFANGDADLPALIDDLVTTATTALGNLMPAIQQALIGVGDFIVQMAPVIGAKLPELLNALLPTLIQAAISLVQALVTAMPEIIQAVISVLPDLMQFLIDSILTLVQMLIPLGLDIILALADGLIQALPELIPAIVDVILTIVDKLTEPDTLIMLTNAALQLVLALVQGIFEALPLLIERAPEIIVNLGTALIQALPLLYTATEKLIITIITGIQNLLYKIREIGAIIINTVKDAIMEKVEQAKEWGRDLIDNFVQGIKDKIQAVKDTISNVADAVAERIHFSEPDVGPLSNFHTFAPDMMELFSQGIKKNIGLVTSAMNEMTGEISATVTANNSVVSGEVYVPGDNGAQGGGYVQNIYVSSPKALTPSEVARQTRNATRQMVLALKGV